MAIAGYVLGARVGYKLNTTAEIFDCYQIFEAALKEARNAAISATTCSAPISASSWHAHHGYGAYICGEETALLESIEGKKGQPRLQAARSRRASACTASRPNHHNNTETLASVCRGSCSTAGQSPSIETGQAQQPAVPKLFLGFGSRQHGPANY